MRLDSAVLEWMVAHRTGWLTTVFWIITYVGNTASVFVLSVAAVAALVKGGRRSDAVLIAATMLSGWVSMDLLKLVFARARPPFPERLVVITSYSFPSGHAMMSMMLATVSIAVMLRSTTKWLHRPAVLALPVVAALSIGFSRIYLGAHWTTDVVAGWVIGALWALAWVRATQALSGRNRSAAS